MTTLAQKWVPSLRTRQPSASNRPSNSAVAERQRGYSRGAIGVGVETREVLAEDLVLAIALETLRAGVPAHHLAAGIEHVDRIIGDALNEHLEPVYARLS